MHQISLQRLRQLDVHVCAAVLAFSCSHWVDALYGFKHQNCQFFCRLVCIWSLLGVSEVCLHRADSQWNISLEFTCSLLTWWTAVTSRAWLRNQLAISFLSVNISNIRIFLFPNVGISQALMLSVVSLKFAKQLLVTVHLNPVEVKNTF